MNDFLAKLIPWTFKSGIWVAFLLMMATYLAYRPSLSSDFVYDARKEILDEGFITSLSNLPSVLSLKVLNMDLMLGSRPGQMLYLMLNAALWGKEPFGYHFSSNLLHAMNVGLLFLLLVRLTTEITGLVGASAAKIQTAAAACALIFALHPIAVESVAEISYSSSLLVTFFTLMALLAATFFNRANFPTNAWVGGLGVFCAFASVTCKESGIAAALILLAYWTIFRRKEDKLPWLIFMGSAAAVTVAFLSARFMFPPPPGNNPPTYLGGSFGETLWIQPRLWVFMMGKLLWPANLSADYTLSDLGGLSSPFAQFILALVILLQLTLAIRSRIGALGVAAYWSGLLTVSNFVPLLHPVADRFYYLPLAGIAMQLFALLLLMLRRNAAFWLVAFSVMIATVPLALSTISREAVFSSNLAMWKDTVQASPESEVAHYAYGLALSDQGQWDQAIPEFNKALILKSDDYEAMASLGIALFQKGDSDEAIAQFRNSIKITPDYPQAHYNLAQALLKMGRAKEAIPEFEESLRLKPGDRDASEGLAQAKAVAGK